MGSSSISISRSRIKDISGQRFGRMLVLSFAGQVESSRAALFLCVCDCGNERTITGISLRSGNTQSCGCLQAERSTHHIKYVSLKHGMTSAPEFKVWDAMRRRCNSQADESYHRYGGRGIRVCEQWDHDFAAFYADMGPRPSPRHSIEREDNSKGYEPGNCVWATVHQQTRNRRSNIRVSYRGQDMILKDAAVLAGVQPPTAYARYAKGWPLERVLDPARYRRIE